MDMKNLSLASASLLFVPWRCSALATCRLQFLVTMASVLTEGQQHMLLQQVRRIVCFSYNQVVALLKQNVPTVGAWRSTIRTAGHIDSRKIMQKRYYAISAQQEI